jgi:hypothetical protein
MNIVLSSLAIWVDAVQGLKPAPTWAIAGFNSLAGALALSRPRLQKTALVERCGNDEPT